MFFAYALSAFRTQASFRSQTFMRIIGGAVVVFSRVSIWTSVYGHQQSMDGIGLLQMVTYAIIGTTLLSAWDASQMVREIGADIRSGDVVSQLMRPYSYPVSLFARQFGVRGFDMLAVGVPVLAGASLLYGFQPPASLVHALLFVPFVFLSLVILFGLATFVGLLVFWVMDVLALDWFLRGMLAFFSGGLVPLWFFPDWAQGVAQHLPFAWVTFYPMAVYLGQMDAATAFLYLAFGAGWAVFLAGLIAFTWRRACLRLVIQGG
ncbi:ABC transporter permease [Rhizobium sp. PAMB 3182]